MFMRVFSVTSKRTLFLGPRKQADHLARRGIEGEWFFCRGFFRQSTGEFVLWRAVPEEGADSDDVRLHAMSAHARKRMKVGKGTVAVVGDVPDVAATDMCRRSLNLHQVQHQGPLVPMAAGSVAEQQQQQQAAEAAAKKAFDKGPGRQCVECGATQTPQWREGPAGVSAEEDMSPTLHTARQAGCVHCSLQHDCLCLPSDLTCTLTGPKTLCNACGVRYNRLRASKRNGNFTRPSKGKVRWEGADHRCCLGILCS